MAQVYNYVIIIRNKRVAFQRFWAKNPVIVLFSAEMCYLYRRTPPRCFGKLEVTSE